MGNCVALLKVTLEKRVQPMAFPICRRKPVASPDQKIQWTLSWFRSPTISHAGPGSPSCWSGKIEKLIPSPYTTKCSSWSQPAGTLDQRIPALHMPSYCLTWVGNQSNSPSQLFSPSGTPSLASLSSGLKLQPCPKIYHNSDPTKQWPHQRYYQQTCPDT